MSVFQSCVSTTQTASISDDIWIGLGYRILKLTTQTIFSFDNVQDNGMSRSSTKERMATFSQEIEKEASQRESVASDRVHRLSLHFSWLVIAIHRLKNFRRLHVWRCFGSAAHRETGPRRNGHR